MKEKLRQEQELSLSRSLHSIATRVLIVFSLSLLPALPVSNFISTAHGTSLGTSSSVTISTSETQTVLNNALTLSDSLTISGYVDDVRITVSTDTGTVRITVNTGLYDVSGFDNADASGFVRSLADPDLLNAGDEIAFEGSVAEVQAALNSIEYRSNNVTGTGQITISVSYVGSGSVAYNSDNGHYYVMYTHATAIPWHQVYDSTTASNNCGITFNNLCGYLATSTSDTETSFIKSKAASAAAWLGGYETTTTGSGVWRWVPNSPESTTAKGIFFIDGQDSSGASGGQDGSLFVNGCNDSLKGLCSGGTGVAGETITAMHNNWDNLEPNDDSTGAGDALQVLSGGTGFWNDLTQFSATLTNYIIEFGGKSWETPTYSAKSRTVLVSYTKPSALVVSNSQTCQAPSISSISPEGGASSGGTRLTISGQGLSNANIYIGGSLATLASSSVGSIVVTTPAGVKGSAVLRIEGCGTSVSSTYLYDPDPVIYSILPNIVSTSGSIVSVSGKFLTGATISVGGVNATIKATTDASITAFLPASSAGSKTITFSTSFGASTSIVTYVSPPILAVALPSTYIAQGDQVSISISAVGASSYSANGTLPIGLTLNPSTGAITGRAEREGIYAFAVTATNSVGSDTKNYTLNVDRPTPRALSANIYFAHKATSLSATNRSSLDRLINRIKAVEPRNLSATILVSGGDAGSRANLTSERFNQVKRYLEASGMRIKSVSSLPGSANKFGVFVNWVR